MLRPSLASNPLLIRNFFLEAGYDQSSFWTPGLRDAVMRRGGGTVYVAERTSEPSRVNVLYRLFLLGVSVERRVADEVIPAPVLDELADCGLIELADDAVNATVMISRVGDRLFAADRADAIDRPDVVIWPNPTTRMLDLFTVRSPSRLTLDLGAGCGVQAVLASTHSDEVLATDLNTRAAEFTNFNAWLNGSPNVRTAVGDTFAPAAGMQFDLILANPPFFVGPATGRMFCESGMELDGYCRRVAREAPSFLREGGWFQMVFEWVEVAGQSWQDRLVEWLDGSGCDAWVLHGYAYEPALYAETRAGQSETGQSDPETLARWLAYFHRENVARIHGGMLALRRRRGSNWIRMDEAAHQPSEPFGDEIVETFDSQTALARCTDDQLMETMPRVAANSRLHQELAAADGGWSLVRMTLARTGVIPASLPLEGQVAAFIATCDGRHTLRELAQELSTRVSAEPEEVRRQCRDIVRRLVETRLMIL